MKGFFVSDYFNILLSDVSSFLKYKHSTIVAGKDLEYEHPLIDFTDPSLLSLLFTDIGILSPSAVSDELVKLYL